jgi:hypothetical protein
MPASKTAVAEYMKIRRYVLNLIMKSGNESVQLPTAQELAKLFGVCRQTVGKSLKQLAEENYVIGKPGLGTFTNPKKQFRFESRRNRPNIGIIVGDGMIIEMDEFLARTVAACLVEVAVYPAYVRSINLTSTKPDVVFKELKNEFLDGLIWQNPPLEFQPLLKKIRENGIAVVVIGGSSHRNAVPSVDFDLSALGYAYGKRLLEMGKRNLLYLRDERPWNFPADGIRKAYREAGVSLNEKLFLNGVDTLAKVKMIFELGVPVDAIVNALYSYEDLALVAQQTDFDLGRMFHVCWESVAAKFPVFHGISHSYDFTAMAKTAVALLRRQLEEKDRTIRSELVPLQLHEVG